MKTDPTLWVIARASGLCAYGLLTLSVLAGLVVKSRPVRALKVSAVTDVHRFITALAIGGVAVHGTALYLDTKIPFTVQELLLPGIAPYRPLWTGMGILAGELMLVIHLSFSVRRWIGGKNWRRLHYSTYAVFAAATVHGLMSGTDSSQKWTMLVYVAAIGLVVSFTSWRILAPPPAPKARRAAEA